MMRVRNSVTVLAIASLAVVPGGLRAAGTDGGSGRPALVVRAHAGAEAIDVSGFGPSNQMVKVTLLSTWSIDVPDAVLSRTIVMTNGDGRYAATISIAPGFTRGSVITVYVLPASGPTVSARYDPTAPNAGSVVPLDRVPSSVR